MAAIAQVHGRIVRVRRGVLHEGWPAIPAKSSAGVLSVNPWSGTHRIQVHPLMFQDISPSMVASLEGRNSDRGFLMRAREEQDFRRDAPPSGTTGASLRGMARLQVKHGDVGVKAWGVG